MYFEFGCPDHLGKAVEIGFENGIYEGEDFQIDAEQNRITFFQNCKDEQDAFLSALKHHNSAHFRGDYICFNVRHRLTQDIES